MSIKIQLLSHKLLIYQIFQYLSKLMQLKTNQIKPHQSKKNKDKTFVIKARIISEKYTNSLLFGLFQTRIFIFCFKILI